MSHLQWERARANANLFLASLSLLNVNIKLDSLWSYLQAMSLSPNINEPLPLLIDVHFGCGIKRRHIGGNLGSTLEDRRQFTANRVPQILQFLRIRPRVVWLRGWKQFLNFIFVSWTINSRDCTAFLMKKWQFSYAKLCQMQRHIFMRLVAKTLTTTTFIFLTQQFNSAINKSLILHLCVFTYMGEIVIFW